MSILETARDGGVIVLKRARWKYRFHASTHFPFYFGCAQIPQADANVRDKKWTRKILRESNLQQGSRIIGMAASASELSRRAIASECEYSLTIRIFRIACPQFASRAG